MDDGGHEMQDCNKYQRIDREKPKRLTCSFGQVDDENNGQPNHAMRTDLHDSSCETSMKSHTRDGYWSLRNVNREWMRDE